MYGCRIDRDHIDRILRLASQDFSSTANRYVMSTREYGGIYSSIYGRTIEELLNSVKESTLPGDPDYVDNLTFRLIENPQTRFTQIMIRPEQVQVIVDGTDPEWVRGRIGSLKALFSYTRLKWPIPPRTLDNITVFSLLILAVVSVWAIATSADP